MIRRSKLTCLQAAVVGVVILMATATTLVAQYSAQPAAAPPDPPPFSFGRTFTFLFLTLGPFKILEPFATMTHGRDGRFKRRLAFQAILIASLAILTAGTIGVRILQQWAISIGAMLLTVGLILTVIALRQVLEQYAPHEGPRTASAPESAPSPSPAALAFSPLAFPTIVTPYGLAVVIMLVALRSGTSGHVLQIYAVAALVLALDLVAMLFGDRIVNMPVLRSALGIAGVVMAVMQVALGLQASADGLHRLGFGAGGA